jgi:hypothetical protein
LEQACDPELQQMTRLPWGTMDTVGDQSDYVNKMLVIIKQYSTVVGRTIANKRYFRTFNDRFAEYVMKSIYKMYYYCDADMKSLLEYL